MGLFRRKNKAPRLPRGKLLRAKPVRNRLCAWEEAGEGEITVRVPTSRQGWRGWLARLCSIPREYAVALDPVGAKVWGLCDGETTVEEIVKALCETYSLERREAETSLMRYLEQLGKRGLVVLAVPIEPQGP